MSQDWAAVRKLVNEDWDSTIVPSICEYVKVPNVSPNYDPEWKTNGLMMKALNIQIDWLKTQPVKGMKYELFEEKDRTPFLLIEIEGTTPTATTAFLYAHMDKQPPLDADTWEPGLSAYNPVIRDGKLYGRGGADDGYGFYAAVNSIVALQKNNIPHARCCICIEACEESGSFDLPYYITKCKDRLGDVDLIVCLDSGGGDYETLWLTTSLRGIAAGKLVVKQCKDSMHSGIAGGVVPDAFRICRLLLDRIEDPKTGVVTVPELMIDVPQPTLDKLKLLNNLGDTFKSAYPMLPGASLEPGDNYELALRNFWRSSVTVVGADLPPVETAGNVIRNQCTLKLSIRVPPGVNPDKAQEAVKRILESDPPYGAKVTYSPIVSGPGWAAPELKPWLYDALTHGSQEFYKRDFGVLGIGGSIPFMGMLGDLYPKAQFFVTGVLGPNSNAHGPNEFLHIDTAKAVSYCTSRALAAHYVQAPKL